MATVGVKGIYIVTEKTYDYILYNNFNNNCPITIIFGIVTSNLCIIEDCFFASI